MTDIRLNKRQIEALREVADYTRRGWPHWWRIRSVAHLAKLGLVGACPRRGSAVVTDAGTAWLARFGANQPPQQPTETVAT